LVQWCDKSSESSKCDY